MFNISFAELIVILLLGALILGPGEIGAVARFCGRAVRKSRGLLSEIKAYVNADDGELDDIKAAAEEIKGVKDDLNPREFLNQTVTDTKSQQDETARKESERRLP